MGFDPELLKQLLDTFSIELEEQLQLIIEGLLQLEKATLEKKEQTKTIETIFRAAHNIKGTSRSLNINNVADIAHHIESLFFSIQKKTLTTSPTIIDLCFEAVDRMRLAMQFFLAEQPLSFDLPELLDRLEKGEPKKIEQEKTKIETNVNVIKMEETSSTHEHLTPHEPIGHDTIRVSIENLDRIAALMEEMQVNKIAIDDHYTELTKLATNAKQLTQLWQKARLAQKNYISTETSENLQKIVHNCNDSLMEVSHSIDQLHTNMGLRINELTTVSHSLQEEMRMLRLIPAAILLQSLPRTVRDLANEMNKKVELIIKGEEVKMDKMVLEGLKDPIMHLLRNAIDHGIESPEQRKTHGKSDIGHIWIEVKEEGNQILIRIKDDGAGIDIRNIAKISAKKNLVSKSELESMSEPEILDLIFSPGFSTREIITTVSGRGVGLNVVKENITHLKGHVSVSTELGKSTTFDLHVPLTLASERGLIVRSGGQLFVIPTSSVERVLSLPSNEIIDVGSDQAILIEKHPVPLRSLADILRIETREPLLLDRLPLVVIRNDVHAIALLVEAIVGEREIVVKPLQAPANNLPGISGGTLSGSGHVMIVLNPSDIITMTLHGGKVTRVKMQDDKIKSHTKVHILVVDDSITTRTLEKSILENKGYQVTIAVDGKEAWDALQKQKFALLITDVMMPSVDGFTLTDRVKKNEKLKNMPVIIVTSLGSDAEKKRGIEVGADAYIVKSEFESGILLEIVEQLV